MTAYSNFEGEEHLNRFRLKLIERITQVSDLELIRIVAENLSVDLEATDVDGIRKTPGVAGGSACVRNTRIPVWLLVSYRALGKNESWFLQNYPGLTQEDLAQAWKYSELHPEEIKEAIRENDEA